MLPKNEWDSLVGKYFVLTDFRRGQIIAEPYPKVFIVHYSQEGIDGGEDLLTLEELIENEASLFQKPLNEANQEI